VRALPSGKTSRVKSIVTYAGELGEAYAPMSVTVTLEDEIDVSRGDMLVHAEAERGAEGGARPVPTVAADVEAMVVWMNEVPLVAGKRYWFKQATRLVSGSMVELQHAVDVNTLAQKPAKRLNLNEVGRVSLALAQAVVFDAYKVNPATGAFIIIDRITNNTVGAGMILGRRQAAQSTRGAVSAEEKETRLGQRGMAVWVARPLAALLERALFEEARTVVRLDTADGGWRHVPAGDEALAALLRAYTEQGIITLLSGEETEPPEFLRRALGARLVHCTEAGLEGALALLAAKGITAEEEATEGEGI
jgi:hypothetical protein